MDLVIDFQCFRDNENRVIPKEVAVLSVKQDFSAHWITAPLYKSNKLKSDVRRTNNWLTLNHHGLDWYDGEVSVKDVYKNLRGICRRADKIYVRGREKAALLSKVTTREIINLELEDDCPPFQKLTWCENYCMQHAIKPTHIRFSCALNNAYRLKNWLNLRRRNIGEDYDFSPPLGLCDDQNGESRDTVDSCTNPFTYSGSVFSRPDSSSLGKASCFCS